MTLKNGESKNVLKFDVEIDGMCDYVLYFFYHNDYPFKHEN